jgi:hypothetical protein
MCGLAQHYLHKYRALHSHLEGAAALTTGGGGGGGEDDEGSAIDRRRGRALLASPREILLKRELAEVTAERNQNLLYYLWKKDAASHMEVRVTPSFTQRASRRVDLAGTLSFLHDSFWCRAGVSLLIG